MAQEFAAICLLEFLEEEDRMINYRIESRMLRDAMNPFELPEDRFIEIYRLNRDLTRYLIQELRPHLPCGTTSRALSIETKVLTALHFYGQGSYQKSVGKDRHVSLSQSSVSRCIEDVSSAITQHVSHKWIHFPNNDIEIKESQEKFYRRYGFPGVIGCVDGTQIIVNGPSDADIRLAYYNRKGDYSINVQLVCGANAEILAVNARYPGSVHDAAIWETSSTRTSLWRNQRPGVFLLGDSGYPLEPWIMTPVMGNVDEAAARYNRKHKSTRNCVERTIGYMKMKFRTIFKHRGLPYKHAAAGNIIYACTTLHNMCIYANLYEEEPNLIEGDEDAEDEIQNLDLENAHLAAGLAVRADLINRYFRA